MVQSYYLIRISPREIGRRYRELYKDQTLGSWYLSKNLDTLIVCELEYIEWIEKLQNFKHIAKGALITRWEPPADVTQELQRAYSQFRSEADRQSTSGEHALGTHT